MTGILIVRRALAHLQAHHQVTERFYFLRETGWGRRAILTQKTKSLIAHDRILRGEA